MRTFGFASNHLPWAGLALIAMAGAACIPINQQTNFEPGTADSIYDLGSDDGVGDSTTDDDSLGQCRAYDPTNPDKGICDDCYASILGSRCSTVTASSCTSDPTDPSQCCKDPSVRKNFSALVNQCISQTIVAGFTCSITSCPPTMVLNPTTCSCIADNTSVGPVGAGGGSTIDVGQTDFGPPIVTAQMPDSGTAYAIEGVAGSQDPFTGCSPGAAADATLPSPVRFSIRNRGDTVPYLNSYGLPTPSDKATAVNESGTPIALSATVPVPLGAAGSSQSHGLESKIRFQSGGAADIDFASFTTDSGGQVGDVLHFSGNVGSGGSASGGIGTHGGDGGVASAAGWSEPRFGARDRYGNIYFAESKVGDFVGTNVGVIRVVCNDVTSAATYNRWCNGKTRGRIYSIAGAVDNGVDPITLGSCLFWMVNASYSGSGNSFADYTAGTHCQASGNAAANTAMILDPTGVAVDRYGNIFFSSTQGQMVGVVCGSSGQGWCNGARVAHLAGNVYRVAGTAATAEASSGTIAGQAVEAALLDEPMGIDIQTESGDVTNVFVAERSGQRIRRYCEFSAPGPCQDWSGADAARVDDLPGASGIAYTDIKVNRYGNAILASADSHVVKRACYTAGRGDICHSSAVSGAIRTFGSADTPGTSGDGLQVTSSTTRFSSPFSIALTEPYADYRVGATNVEVDFDGAIGFQSLLRTEYADNHFVIIESFFDPGSDASTDNDAYGGNTARLYCGRRSATSGEGPGFCAGKSQGALYRIAGRSGMFKSFDGGGTGARGTDTHFANLYAGVFDTEKNLVLSSTSLEWPLGSGTFYHDESLRVLHRLKTTAPSSIRYRFTDSNLLSASYCLQFRVETQCSRFDGNMACACKLVMPENPEEFWVGVSDSTSCQY